MPVKNTNSKLEASFLATTYVRLYNLAQVLGWSYILYQILWYYAGGPQREQSLWDTVKLSVNIFQNAALLEILHAATGLVKSNPVLTTFQVLSRVIVVCGVILATPSDYAASSYGLPMALLAWSITEIIRYGYYLSHLLGCHLRFIVWLRYTTFVILYPIGVTGELLCFYAAQKYASTHPQAWSYALPNKWNFTFSYHCLLISIMLLYIPLFPQLYLHMFAQRRKVLNPQSDAQKAK